VFNVTIEQQALMKALEYLEPTVGKNSTGVGDNCLSMISSTAGSIIAYTTNTIEFTQVEVVATTNGNTTFSSPPVDFKRFKGIIATVPATEFITLQQSVNDLLITFSLRSKPIRLVGCTNGMLPIPAVQSNLLITLSKTFIKNVIEKASNIITESQSSPIYNCINISTDGMDITAEAIDVTNKRTYAAKSTGALKNPKLSVLVDVPKFKKSLKIFEDYDDIEMTMDNSIVMLRGDNKVQYGQKSKGQILDVTYISRRLSSPFPNVMSYFKSLPGEFVTIPREDVLSSIGRVKALGEESSFKTGVKIDASGKSLCMTFNSPYGDMVDPIDVATGIQGSFTAIFRHNCFEDLMKALSDSSHVDIGQMANANGTYVIRTGSSGSCGSASINITDMFTMSSMAGITTP
jgi:DNA polymerase III sliding clamp (beta) subunit (PCNA family)